MKEVRIGDQRYEIRIRRNSNASWRDQFTIRDAEKSGYPTEYEKLIHNNWCEGCGNE